MRLERGQVRSSPRDRETLWLSSRSRRDWWDSNWMSNRDEMPICRGRLWATKLWWTARWLLLTDRDSLQVRLRLRSRPPDSKTCTKGPWKSKELKIWRTWFKDRSKRLLPRGRWTWSRGRTAPDSRLRRSSLVRPMSKLITRQTSSAWREKSSN